MNSIDGFPDYDATNVFFDALARLEPLGATNTTWRNDLCPSIGTNCARLWIDYSDVESRELDCKQFAVSIMDDDWCLLDHAEFDDIENAITFFVKEALQ